MIRMPVPPAKKIYRPCPRFLVLSEKNYVDTHGQSEIAFAFCHLLGFELLPRLKAIHRKRLYRPEKGTPEACPNLQEVLTRPIRWGLIEEQYDSGGPLRHGAPARNSRDG